jgi:hypothetical protein
MVKPPATIELTEAERALAAQIDFDPDRMRLHGRFDEVLEESCTAAKQLAMSLLERKAIPQGRLDYFIDPEFNVGSKRSRKEIFEENGTRGDEILEHAHFLPYLKYFPDLGMNVIEGFCEQVNSDDDQQLLRAYARRMVREQKLDRRHASEEFYKLALECRLDEGTARSIRDAARQTR